VRLGQLAEGRYSGPATERVKFEELAEPLVTDYRTNGKKSLVDLKIRLYKHLQPFFAGCKAHDITTVDVRAYVASRQEAGAVNATINRELAALKRAFTLVLQAGTIHKKPHIPMLQEDNARQGFFEPWEFERVLSALPNYLQPPVTCAYYTGWRRGEILSLTWAQVDLEASTVRLYRCATKNGEGRLLHLPRVLLDILEQQWQDHLARYPDCPWVFHKQGQQMRTFYKAWLRTCQAAGLAGKLAHDFRRTAVRNLVRAGVPERVAMMLTGHKTREVFERYNIVSAQDLEDAAKRIDERIVTRTTTLPLKPDRDVPVSH
jgi:integrase